MEMWITMIEYLRQPCGYELYIITAGPFFRSSYGSPPGKNTTWRYHVKRWFLERFTLLIRRMTCTRNMPGATRTSYSSRSPAPTRRIH